jgi:hypothetical protein
VPGREVTFDGEGGVLFNKCLEDADCFRAYWTALDLVTHAVPGIESAALAEDSADLLAPWQEEERDNGRPDPESDEVDEIEEGVDETIEFAAGRQAEAEDWLAANEPPLVVSDHFSTPAGPALPGPNAPSSPARFVSSERSGRQLVAHLRLSSAGTVALRASMKTSKGRRRVCSASKAATGAGEWPLRCKLSRAAMDRLAQGPLKLKLVFTVAPAGGSAEAIVRSIRLARD